MSDEQQPEGFANELGEVHLCGCGGVNLTIGAVTVHFEAPEVSELFELADAAYELVQHAPAAASSEDEPSDQSTKTDPGFH